MKQVYLFKKRCLCISKKGRPQKSSGWLQMSFLLAIGVVLFASLLFSCSPTGATEQVQITRTQPISTPLAPTATIETGSPPQAITSTPTLTLAPIPATTSDLIPTLTIAVEDGRVIAAMVYADIGEIVLVGPTGTPVRTIHLNAIQVAWSPEGCQLQATVTTGEDIRLLSVDLSGQVLQELFVGGYNSVGGWQTSPMLSPTGEWVAYIVWSGERYRVGAEFQDVEVMAVERQAEPSHLTERGGAWVWGAVWSPDGRRLAYSDYDEAEIAQVYHSLPDGSDRLQLTEFTTPGLKVGAIKWSLDGQALAFATYYGDNLGGLWVASSDGTDLRQMALDSTSPVEEDWLWWSADGDTLVADTRGYVSADGLYWFDSDTGEVRHTLYASETPYEGIVLPFPIVDVQVMGFVAGDNNIYQYDLVDGSRKLWADQKTLSQGILQQISPVPNGPIDLDFCLQK
jgi:Tol biopolymer transport system component